MAVVIGNILIYAITSSFKLQSICFLQSICYRNYPRDRSLRFSTNYVFRNLKWIMYFTFKFSFVVKRPRAGVAF